LDCEVLLMRRVLFGGVAAALMLVVMTPSWASASTDAGGTVVIVFKDGHQQSIPSSAISAMEFKSAAGVVTPIALPSVIAPSKKHFEGKWLVGDGNGSSFTITLEDDGVARKSIGESHGTWVYVDGEARVSWDDGWHDAIRKVGAKYEKFAYEPGKTFTDTPSNVTEAQSQTPKPI
jgi:hypothetical protein